MIPVVGNIDEPNLGMDSIISQQIAQEIDLIIDSAANTTFDLRLVRSSHLKVVTESTYIFIFLLNELCLHQYCLGMTWLLMLM